MEKKPYSRRKFMNKCLSVGSIFLGGAALLSSCNSEQPGVDEKKPATISGNSCDDLSDVSAEELDKRHRMGYVNKSSAPENYCGNCSLFIPKASGEENQECGGCLLFKGPVYKEGHCIQWAAKA